MGQEEAESVGGGGSEEEGTRLVVTSSYNLAVCSLLASLKPRGAIRSSRQKNQKKKNKEKKRKKKEEKTKASLPNITWR